MVFKMQLLSNMVSFWVSIVSFWFGGVESSTTPNHSLDPKMIQNRVFLLERRSKVSHVSRKLPLQKKVWKIKIDTAIQDIVKDKDHNMATLLGPRD